MSSSANVYPHHMCGISGIISRDGVTLEDRARVAAMSRALFHRGPDDSGDYHAQHVALASRRLSIIDLGGGRQPLYNEDRTLALVANGEIYNHLELRRRLEARGHRFKTKSDCEAILHAYAEFGTDCVNHLRGMFAFALWDAARRRLVLARDPLGEKPLYLCERDGRLLFASEMKALLRSGEVAFELDAEAVDLFFHYQYVPEPRTAVKGVRKLDAAHLLTIDIEPWRVAESCYWRMEDAPPLDGNAPALIRERLEEVGALVTRADVPVGVALSGGLDSSAVASLAKRSRPGELHAFSVGYPGRPAGVDERDEARAFARHLGLRFHEVEVETREVVEFFPELNYWRDDPIADYSGHGYYAVMRKAREQGVPVMLQGQGGDEMFWGYPHLRQAARESFDKETLRGGGLTAPFRYLMPSAPAALNRSTLSRWARDLGGTRAGWRRMREHLTSPAGRLIFYDLLPDYRAAAEGVNDLYGKSFAEQITAGAAALFTLPLPWPRVDLALTRLVSDTYLRANGVAQGDRLAMASSVELRLPLLDRRLVELIVGLRKARTDVRLPPKAWLKSATEGLLPEWVTRRPKRGFAPPVGEWHQALFAAYGEPLRSGYLVEAGVLNRKGADLLARGSFPAGLTSPLSFKALVLEQWCRRMSAEARIPHHVPLPHEVGRQCLESV